MRKRSRFSADCRKSSTLVQNIRSFRRRLNRLLNGARRHYVPLLCLSVVCDSMEDVFYGASSANLRIVGTAGGNNMFDLCARSTQSWLAADL